MRTCVRLLLLSILVLCHSALWADTLTLATAPTGSSFVKWSQLGAGSTLGASFNATTNDGMNVNVAAAGAGTCVATVNGSTGCGSWSPTAPLFNSGDSVLWAFDANSGTGIGPLTFTFGHGVYGFGLAMQDDDVFAFTGVIKAFNGANLLGAFNLASDSNGDPIFIGVSDLTGANITSVQISMNCPSCQDTNDFAVNTAYIDTPEPGSILLFTTGLAGVATALRRRLSR